MLHRSATTTIGSFIMFTTKSEQLTTVIKPFNRLIEINTKYLGQLINQQKTFFTAISWELAAQIKTLSTQTDFIKIINEQKYYTNQIQTKISASTEKTYKVATNNSEDVIDLVKGSISEVNNF